MEVVKNRQSGNWEQKPLTQSPKYRVLCVRDENPPEKDSFVETEMKYHYTAMCNVIDPSLGIKIPAKP